VHPINPSRCPANACLLFQGLRFEVVPSRFKETLSKASFPSPYAYAMETAKQKALEVANRVQQASGHPSFPPGVPGCTELLFAFK
jgi:predicted house-cleaning NTP pyrophosphatase (Maf/HAM1 superfamily)